MDLVAAPTAGGRVHYSCSGCRHPRAHEPTKLCCFLCPAHAGEKPKEDLVAAPTADGRVRHRVGLDEALVPRSSLAPGPQPGKVMEVMAGRHEGLLAAVREILDGKGG